jgi:hypothetical protein
MAVKQKEKCCIKCQATKKLSEFPAKAANKDGLDNRCRACERVRQTEKSRRRRLNAEVKRQDRDYQRQRSKTPEAQAIRKQYRASAHGQAVAKANKAKRLADIAAAVPQRWKKSDCPEHLCYWCGISLRKKNVKTHIEHLMPLSLGGNSDPSNTAPACSTCNLAKSNTHPLVWIASLFDETT